MQEKLQILKYETFCSESFSKPEYLEELIDASQFFDLLIFSETISELMITRGINRLEQTGIPVLRKYSSARTQTRLKTPKEVEVDGKALKNDCTLEELREALSNFESEMQERVKSDPVLSTAQGKAHLNDLHFSTKEYQVMTILYEAGRNYISREELIDQIWEEGMNNSNLAQVSTIMRRIRNKAMKKGIPSNMIRTLWGRGYILEEDVYDYIIFPEKVSEQKRIS